MSQNNPSIIYTGLDIHKATLQLHCQKKGEELPNTKAGHARLLKVLQAAGQPVQLICEASGGYERPVLAALAAAGVPYTLLNARQVRDFAKARGTRAKTDQIDAEVLAAYGSALQPLATRPPTAAQRALQEHVRCRQRLLELLINLRLQAAALTLKPLQRVAQTAIRTLEKQLKTVETLIAALQKADADFEAKVTKLTAVVGVGRLTAWTVLAEMPELGQLGRREVASLAGLAPHPRESGTWKGKPLHRGRSARGAQGTLHGRARGGAQEPHPQSRLPTPAQGRQTTQTRHHRRHAQTPAAAQFHPQASRLQTANRLSRRTHLGRLPVPPERPPVRHPSRKH